MTQSVPMSPFTRLLGRLVELLGAEAAANLVTEFGGKTITFPAGSLYQAPDLSLTEAERTQVLDLMHAMYPTRLPLIDVEEIPDRRRAPRHTSTSDAESQRATVQQRRRVSNRLTVFINATEYDVSHIPGVNVGDTLTLSRQELGSTPLSPLSLLSIYHGDGRNLGEDYQQSPSSLGRQRGVRQDESETHRHKSADLPGGAAHRAPPPYLTASLTLGMRGQSPQCDQPTHQNHDCSCGTQPSR